MYSELSPFTTMSTMLGDPIMENYNSLRPGVMPGQPLTQPGGVQPAGAPGQPQQNLRTEYQSMIGGMSSILQLGFAGVSLVIFTRNFTSIVKATYNFLKKLFNRFGAWVMSLPIIRLIPQLLDKIRTESASMVAQHSSVIGKLIMLCRVVTAACIFGLLYIKKQLKEDNIKDIEQCNADLQHEEATLEERMEEVKYQRENFLF